MTKRRNIAVVLRPPLWPSEGKGSGSIQRIARTDEIVIKWVPRENQQPEVEYLTGLTTRDARLLAKRLNQFLDAGG